MLETVAAELDAIYAQIPKFQCKEGCTDCCGPVPFSLVEWSRVTTKKKATCLDCPYSLNGSCDIYNERPLMCRIFGAVDTPMLECPHGCGPEKKLTKEQGDALIDAYIKLRHKEDVAELRQHRTSKAS